MSEVISVRFRGGCKNYFFDPADWNVRMGDEVIVQTQQGLEFATCTQPRHEVPDALLVKPLCTVVRPASDEDRRTVELHRRREREMFDVAERKIAEHGLEMKLVNVSICFDGKKIIFYFTADGRVDFRSLVRDLASVFRSRIELRQIGVRDEARMTGGLGICGQPFCCSQFLDNFMPVSIKMAKTQNLSLNPAKISGTCGRLMCCLKYEQNAYEDASRRLPKPESFVQTPDGPGNVKSVDLLRETVKVSLDSDPEPPRCYHNCEICLLRNGKGSREGIELPPRPPRRVEERPEEPLDPVFGDLWTEDGGGDLNEPSPNPPTGAEARDTNAAPRASGVGQRVSGGGVRSTGRTVREYSARDWETYEDTDRQNRGGNRGRQRWNNSRRNNPPAGKTAEPPDSEGRENHRGGKPWTPRQNQQKRPPQEGGENPRRSRNYYRGSRRGRSGK